MAEAKEGLWMTAKERDRLKVLHEARQRHITQKQAAAELGLSARWVRTLLGRWRAHGDEALRHGLRGRPSNRKTPEAVKRRVVDLYREKKQAKLWHDYGPTLASEELAEDYGIVISRKSLRQWLIEAKLWRVRRARVERAHVWRARRARYGELVQSDTSEHDWLEGRGTIGHEPRIEPWLPLSCHWLVALAKLDAAANSQEDTDQNGHKANFPSEA